MKKWKVLESLEIFKSPFFRFRVDKCELPDGRVMPKYFTIEFSDWVNIIAITKNLQAVMLRQYRHSAGDWFLEIPGGSTDPGEQEDPKLAAVRELREETGYTSSEIIDLGFHYPNPALQNNKVHTYLALNCEKTHEQELDPYEDLVVELISVKHLIEYVESGKIGHAIIAASLARTLPQLRNLLAKD